ncbi:MAG: Fe(3+) ABC transporter substrate-binding protein [Verrucomicrobiales bacterium]|nr:Fe(3+) ABC transporter substrate-binding protein [Verrucomicrobiales bacterium]
MIKSLVLTVGLVLGFTSQAFSEAKEVTLYTQRHYAFDEIIVAKLQEETGIKVNVVKASADELITRLQEEGENTPADLFMTADGAGLDRAHKAGLLQPITSEAVTSAVPATLKDPENHWVAVTQRARVIVYSPDRVDPAELSTYEDLADPKWRGRIVVRSSSNAYNISLLATLISEIGVEKATEWAAGVRKNMARPPQGSDRDQIRAVAAGLADVALANTYYLGLLETSEEAKDREAAAAVKIFFPNQEGRGAHVNISGIGVVKGTAKAELAEEVIEFLLSEKVQAMYPENTFEFPVNPAASLSDVQKRWGKFKADDVPLSTMGEFNAEAVRTFNRAGWE